MNFLAQSLKISGYEIKGPLPAGKFDTTGDVVNALIKIIFPVALFVLFLYLMMAGFDLTRSMGNPEGFKKAKSKMTNAIVGFILLAVSYWMAEIARNIFWGK